MRVLRDFQCIDDRPVDSCDGSAHCWNRPITRIVGQSADLVILTSFETDRTTYDCVVRWGPIYVRGVAVKINLFSHISRSRYCGLTDTLQVIGCYVCNYFRLVFCRESVTVFYTLISVR